MLTHPHSDLSIPKPCSANWEQMSPDERGRFCTLCSKSVIDFSGKTKEEILEVLKHATGSVCARVPSGLLVQEKIYKRPFLFYAKRFLAVLGLHLFFNNQVYAQVKQLPADSITQSLSQQKSDTVIVRGKVIDSKTKKPLDYASIFLNIHGIVVASTITDDSGSFQFRYTRPLGKNTIASIKCNYIGYQNMLVKEIELIPSHIITVNIALEPWAEGKSETITLGALICRPSLINPEGVSGKTFRSDELRRMKF